MTIPHDLIGRSVDELDTPVLLVDLDRFEANVQHMVKTCRRLGIDWRPHAKGHKSPAVARRLLDAGAIGITCAKLSEAEVFIGAGVDEILVANQLASPLKASRLARLQKQARVIGIVDCPEAVDLLASAAAAEGVVVPVLIDVDTGMHRTGVIPGPAVVALAEHIAKSDAIRLEGIMGFEGHTYKDDLADKTERCTTAIAHLEDARGRLVQAGHDCPIVSAGGTGCYEWSAHLPGLTELQAGGGIFMDAMYREACHVGEELQYALSLLTTVSGVHEDHIVTDAGFKTLWAFHHPPHLQGIDGVEFGYLSAEHGVYRRKEGGHVPAFGDRVVLIPGYHDATTYLHDEFVCVRHGVVEEVWPLQTRGALT
ncbi:MAG: DSD1 family PLP-dependent enzyme [Gemmatimonadetes bacterium]|nr:DSD1 family PLP-dependent enzyme [Gemmatimonadota bacterium]MBT7859234.1 DSD1 family PLP-dependent enzyme [Gemmatimonadota bacterium]